MSVYFVRQGVIGNVKIGSTADITKRMAGLQTGQPAKLLLMRLCEGELAEERALQKRFSGLAIGGEWFRFHGDMLGDIGLVDIPMPRIGKYGKNKNWPETPDEYEWKLHREIIDLLGGTDDLARRAGTRPWLVVYDGRLHVEWWLAAIIALRERGRSDITHKMLRDARDAADAVTRGNEEALARQCQIHDEAYWIKSNPGVIPWWDVLEENQKLLAPKRLELIDGALSDSKDEGIAA